MPLLGDQDSVSKKTPMPINDVTVSTDIIQITSETVDFYFSSGGTRTVDAGQAAGVSVTITVDKAPIYNSEGTHVGDINDSSFSFDNTDTFDSEVLLNDMDRQTLERNDLSWASKLSTITSGLSNGEYKVDYLTGLIFGVKKDADTAEAVTYLTRGFQVVPVSSGGAATYHAEDAAHSSGDTGSMSLAVRNDALAALAGSDGDYAPLQVNATGALYVDSSSTDATHDSAVIATGPQVMLEAKDFDGSALPNAVAEGDATRPAVSLTGVSYTMLTDEDGSDTPLVAESAAIGAATGGTVGLMGMMEAQSTQKAAVTASDAVRPIANLNGEQVNAGHTWATNSNRAEEIDPISEHYAEEELIDTTNVAAATNYFPSSDGKVLGAFNIVSIQGIISGGVTATIEATWDDAASPDWVDITPAGYDLLTNATGGANFVDTNFALDFDQLNARKIRIKSVTADNTNGVQYHWKLRYG